MQPSPPAAGEPPLRGPVQRRLNRGRALLLAAALVLLQACSPSPAPPPAPPKPAPPTPEQIYERVSPSVATLYAADAARRIVGRGSGVFLDPELLVTNCHVIARGTRFEVRYMRKQASARLVAYDGERDLCVLHVRGLDGAPARVGEVEGLRVGQRVYAIGTPQGFELTMSEGLISGLRESAGGRYIQTTAPLSEGSSGGGLFDGDARLIGITSFIYSDGQNLNFAAPAQWAAELVKKVSGAGPLAAAQAVELPPRYTATWRHPLLK
jgi:serine protease Do